MNSTVGIVGGGIGGLALALGLQRRGVEVHVYEASNVTEPIDTGILLPSNAMMMLEKLGLASAVEDAGVVLDSIEVHDPMYGHLHSLNLGAVASQLGFSTVALNRRDLHSALRSALDPASLHLGCRFASLEMADDPEDGVMASFDNGDEVWCGLLVGADGLRSSVREAVFGGSRLRYGGRSCWRGMSPLALGKSQVKIGRRIWAGDAVFAFTALASDRVSWMAGLKAKAGTVVDRRDALKMLEDAFAQFPEPVPTVISTTDCSTIVHNEIYDLKPLRRWWTGPVALLGDAAHASTPNLGQGAAQALEDAAVLTDNLTRYSNPNHALWEYERVRRPRANKVVTASRRLGRLEHINSRAARYLRASTMRAVGDKVGERWSRRLFSPGS